MNKSQHNIVNYINKLESNYPYINIVNACTDITGFGLLGHLSEMLEATNNDLLKNNLEPVKIILELDNIPFYYGVDELLNNGFESTLSSANEIFLKNIYGDKKIRLELRNNDILYDSQLYKNMLKLLIDPQTCGPLVISCSSLNSDKLIQKGPWKKIGFIS
tara:strand:- start:1934 stop:2416 length:483 start_codon:yes stop_codon:yes gene_type:complete